jgi:hypothetical protein
MDFEAAIARLSAALRQHNRGTRTMIEFAHIITADDPFGEPWPLDGSCSIVRRPSTGFTLWRCIRLSETRAHVTPPASRDSSLGSNEDTMTKHQKTQNLKTEKEEMKQKTESSGLPAVQPQAVTTETLVQLDADLVALAAEARELADDIRIGDDLRFTKGRWHKIVGKKDTAVSTTTTFVIDMLSYKRGWIKWIDRKPVFKAIGRPIDGFISPARYRVPDRDDNSWPRDSKGVPQDPWQETFYVVMRDLSDDRLCTWTVTSYYGSKALGALLKIYTRDVKQHAGLMPVVLLSSETKPTVDYGDVEAPLIKIVNWKAFGPDAAPPGMKLPQPEFPKTQEVLPPPKKSIGDDMNDEVLF